MNAYGLPRLRFILLFAVMLVAAAGNTAMQSLMPAIGRQLGIPDLWTGLVFSLSAIVWVVTAPYWARMADKRGRRALMRLGLYGFIVSTLICGGILAVGLAGLVAPATVFIVFALGRGIYGGWGSASPPAVQAYIAARTEGTQRTNALAAIASSFGLGTIVGPAIAPLFIFPPLGLAGPLIVFALIGVAVLAALVAGLPDDTPRREARGQVVDYPSLGGMSPGPSPEADAPAPPAPLRWRDPRLLPWLAMGLIGGHGHAALLTVIGFHVIDVLALPVAGAQQSIAIVLMVGALATLLAQWWLIPTLALSPRVLVAWGSLLAALGCVITGEAGGLYGVTLGFAIASVGFGMFRPGFTSGASMALDAAEQNRAAGMITAANGAAFIAAPGLGVALYALDRPLPFIATAVLMVGLALWVSLRRYPSGRAA